MLLNRKAFGLALGFVFALLVFFIGLAGAFGLGEELVRFIGQFYIGFGPTFEGSFVGMLWAFVEGYALGFFFAWIYNRFAKRQEEL